MLTKYKRLIVGTLDSKKESVDKSRSFEEVPYATISAFQGQASAYFMESHHKFAAAVREFVAKELMPIATTNDQRDIYPDAELKVRSDGRTRVCGGIVVCSMHTGKRVAVNIGVHRHTHARTQTYTHATLATTAATCFL